MDARDFVALTLLAAGGHVQGKTKLQKLVYFVAVLTDTIDELGYRAHFYGPYSDEVADAVGQLRAIGAVDQNVTDWGLDRAGFEVRRHDFRLNEAGERFAGTVARRRSDLWQKVQSAFRVYQSAGDRDYMALSIAAKAYFLLGQKKGVSSIPDLAKLAPRFGWSVTPEQLKDAAKYLQKLNLVEATAR